ncbi:MULTISPECIES: GNAT family N-acetyltransferase [Mycobacteriaceae]|uniref:GNAT family N-acetyltransferase n=1 Tax=Mycobacteriaceae TaxID=1762 RepID=UPI0007FFC001|nr:MULTISPECIES: GNAT family N-acetyltransferase [Mycobacteriaceae]MCK0177048.1 GNAT family N-acetyltransferase [Mycolicibacterium sp. F2034L]OBB57664.1 GNAT family acetyltransferase [Mycobacterium sp. 852013-51886_SCH5428379]
MPPQTVRRATVGDVPAVERLVAAAFDRYVERIGRPPAPMTHDYRALLDTARVWVSEGADGVTGVLVTVPHDDHLLLDTVAVCPRAQGGGVGAVLLARAEDDARELGLPEVRLHTNVAMTENLTFYPRHGYTESGRGRRDGYDRVFYVKRVSGSSASAR